MGVAKLFVWGEGVWRELDVTSGRVSGWRRRARFVFVRRGRLQVARRRAVLSALRALVAGRPGAAADGPRLAHRSKSAVRSSKHKREACAPAPAAPPPAPCSHCCAHYNGCNNNANIVPVDAGATPALALERAADGRTREAGTQCTKNALTINVKHAHAHSSRPDSSGDEFVSKPARNNASEVNALLAKHRPGPKSRRLQPRATDSEPHAPRALKDTTKSSDDRPTPKISQHRDKKKPAPTSINVVQSADDRKARAPAGGGGGGGGGGVCKELIVPESDVAALRGFVARTRASALARFDADDEYKRALFYAINPLVELPRCARLERRLCSRFAAHLGLAPSPSADLGLAPSSSADLGLAPAPMSAADLRHRAAMRCLQRSSTSSSSSMMDTDKENKDDERTPTRERHERSTKSKARQATPPRSEAARVKRLGESARANREPGGGQRGAGAGARRGAAPAPPGDRQPAPDAAGPAARIAGAAHVISKRGMVGGGKEYSNLEDHAIVAWLSGGGGGRASLVNGNRVWRQLQDQFPRLAGRSRSWHSLRNRYLRYILPALGSLRLPPDDVTRLRAAAATGAIKRKNGALGGAGAGAAGAGAEARQRRNSMFKEVAVRGASSRRPPAPGAPTPRPSPPDDNEDDETYKPSASFTRNQGVATALRRSLRSEAHEQDSNKATATPREQDGNKASAPRREQDGNKASAPRREQDGNRASAAPRSPRYSDVTRRFAARHRRARASSSSPPDSSRSSSPAAPARAPPAAAPSSPAPRSRRLFNPRTLL